MRRGRWVEAFGGLRSRGGRMKVSEQQRRGNPWNRIALFLYLIPQLKCHNFSFSLSLLLSSRLQFVFLCGKSPESSLRSAFPCNLYWLRCFARGSTTYSPSDYPRPPSRNQYVQFIRTIKVNEMHPLIASHHLQWHGPKQDLLSCYMIC